MDAIRGQGQTSVLIELCVEDARGVRVARDSGADRVELARDLTCGGLTPEADVFLEALRFAPPQGIRVLVRENPSSFQLTGEQIALQSASIRALAALIPTHGPQVGFVVGGLTGKRLNIAAARAWRRAAGSRYLVFHRAFDEVLDQEEALLQLIELGYDAVLTTGGPAGVADPAGLSRLRTLANGRIVIIGSGGVRHHNAKDVVSRAGLTDVHFRIPDAGAPDAGLSDVQQVVALIRSI